MCNPNSSIANRRPRTLEFLPKSLVSGPTKLSSAPTKELFDALQNTKVADGGAYFNSSALTTVSFEPPRAMESEDASRHDYFTIPTTLSTLQQLPAFPSNPKPKRRRKPQKPGKTAKLNDRHFVVHDYHDHANDRDEGDDSEEEQHGRRRGGVTVPFPLKLHAVLDQVEEDGLAHIISWQPHGRCFVIHRPKEFTEHVMPQYFRQTKLVSFQRQLNLYGFLRITRGNDAGGYYHERFLRGKTFLCKRMVRTKVKGTKFKAASSPDLEPDFYSMPPVSVTPSSSEYGSSSEDDAENTHGQPTIGGYYGNFEARTTSYSVPYCSSEATTPPASNCTLAVTSSSSSQDMIPLSPMPYEQQSSYSGTTPLVARPSGTGDLRSLCDEVLEEAVEDLFMQDDTFTPKDDSVIDFVNIWDPTAFGPDAALENDTQLGNLLEKLLEA